MWRKVGQGGGEYLSISLDADFLNNLVNLSPAEQTKISLVAFPNMSKKSDKSPDYWIQAPRKEKAKSPASGGNDSDIPF